MFQVDKIQTGLLGLVGVRQPFNPDYAKFDAANIASRSGLFIDDIANFNAEFFIDTQNYSSISDTDLNEHLRNLQRSAIVSVCQQVFGQKSYTDRNLLYSQASTRTATETTIQNGFVGFKINPSLTKNTAFKITQIRCEFQGTGTVKILLFNSAVNTPLYEKDVTISSTYQIEDLDWEVNNTMGDYKGEYYLGYIYDGSLVPFKRDYENSDYQNSIAEFAVNKSYVPNSTVTTLGALEQEVYLSENTGINPDITVYDDYTDMILQNESIFAQAIKYEYAIQVMQRYLASTRSNRNERLSKDIIFRTVETIEGSAPTSPVNVTGVKELLGKEVSMLRKTIEDMKSAYFGDDIQVITVS
jgi:hypothetical protein